MIFIPLRRGEQGAAGRERIYMTAVSESRNWKENPLLYIFFSSSSQKHLGQQSFLTSFNAHRGLKDNFMREKT